MRKRKEHEIQKHAIRSDPLQCNSQWLLPADQEMLPSHCTNLILVTEKHQSSISQTNVWCILNPTSGQIIHATRLSSKNL